MHHHDVLAPTDRATRLAEVLGGDVIHSGLARLALERGGHLRVGLEDYVGDDQPTNAEVVARAVARCAEVGRPVATPDQAAALLDLRR